jgi:DMSO/TMAO reductase YedYZ molybdopterin-dependent catalytic subunit
MGGQVARIAAVAEAGVATRRPRPLLAFSGVVAVAAAVAIGELAAGLIAGIPSPTLSIGRGVIALQPPGAKDFVVSLFGTNDKLALEILIVVVALLIGAGVGILAASRRTAAEAVIGGFAALGFVASIGDPDAQVALAAGAAGLEAIVGIWVLGQLVDLATGATRPPGRTSRAKAALMPDWSRRALLVRGGAIAVASAAGTVAGRVLLEGQRKPPPVGSLPEPSKTASLPTGADLGVPGITPIVMPNDRFYVIDTRFFSYPNIDVATWTLKVTGMVDHPITLTYDELIQLPIIEQYVTIACVSNFVGGDLVGNALWRGVELRRVLEMAGVQPAATQLVGRSVDGFTVGMPTEWVMDESRTPMIAIGMNGQPLPRNHGYPARLIVPGLYGYVSATKWLAELELTTLEAFDAYWIPLGWAKEAPILTQSRIDVPKNSSSVKAGPATVAGVAWAPDRGIQKVEVAIRPSPATSFPTDADFKPARLSSPISSATWVQWLYDWTATAGDWEIAVRATDGKGATQTADQSPPAPDGARGQHTIRVSVA